MEPPSSILAPRAYQIEMLASSMERNIIVAMDTGSGKTQVALLRIAAELERSPSEQLVWFLCPTIALATQQWEVISLQLPSVQCRLLSGNDGVDRWSNQTIWDDVLENIRIVISTHKVLEDALIHGFVRMSKIALLVFDEGTHHCVLNHSANKIMQNFYHTNHGPRLPHILGLTASPIVRSNEVSLRTIEHNLNAISRTPRRNRDELLQYVHRPSMDLLLYPPQTHTTRQSLILQELIASCSQLKIEDDPYVKKLRFAGHAYSKQLQKASIERKTYCQDQLRSVVNMATNVQSELGSWAADHFLALCTEKLSSRQVGGSVDFDDKLDADEKRYLVQVLKGGFIATFDKEAVPMEFELTAKTHQLLECLRKELKPGFACLIFVKTRASVRLLATLLSRDSTLKDRLSIGTFVGTSNNMKRKSSIGEIASSDQSETLNDLRSGKKNVVITTSILEEGIDVSACNVVICFEAPPNLKSFIQRRGRARQSVSKYVLMFEEGSIAAVNTWENLEEQMKKMYMDEMRELNRIEVEEIEERTGRVFRIPSTGAQITSDEAVQHLNHFCATLPATQYADLKPTYTFEGAREKGGIFGTVLLPACVDTSVREFRSQTGWHTEKGARCDVAFEAYIALYRAGLVNDNLLPLQCYDDTPAGTFAEIEKQPALVTIQDRFNPWTTMMSSWKSRPEMWKYKIHFKASESLLLTMIMVSPGPVPAVPRFILYPSSKINFEVDITYMESTPYNPDQFVAANLITRLILSSIYASRMDNIQPDFLLLFVPLLQGSETLQQWLQKVTGTIPASELPHTSEELHDVGLVRDSSLNGLRYVLHGMEYRRPDQVLPAGGTVQCDSGGSEDILHLRVTKLSKRGDFLHPIPRDAQERSVDTPHQYVAAESCTIDRMPLLYTEFALFVPSIIHRVEIALLTDMLCKTILEPVTFNRRDLVTTAVSASIAGEATNWQRIELMGDTVLKLLTSLNLMASHLRWHEGYLSKKKDHIVSNGRLAVAAQKTGLDQFILSKAFTGYKWRPLYDHATTAVEAASKTREMSSKSLADVVEALTGASFLDGGITKALTCLSIFLPDVHWISLDKCHEVLTEAAIPNSNVASPEYFVRLETLIAHTFRTKSLLLSAITHPSHLTTGPGATPSYDRLEFLGDAVLDFIITTRVFHHQPALPTGTMHLVRTAMVNANFLAFFCLHHSIPTSRKEITEDIDSRALSAIETEVPLKIWQFMRHSRSQDIATAQQRCVGRYEKLRAQILKAFMQGPSYPWTLLVQLHADKLFSDLIESIIGAIYIDTSGSLEACEGFLKNIGVLGYLDRVLLGETLHVMHPKEELGVVAGNDKLSYDIWVVGEDDDDGRAGIEHKGYACQIRVGECIVCTVGGRRTRVEIETLAAAEAISILRARKNGGGNALSHGGVDG